MPHRGAERRTGEIDDLVAQAMLKPNPVEWVRARVAEALVHIDGGGHGIVLSEAAKRELFEIEREAIARIALQRD